MLSGNDARHQYLVKKYSALSHFQMQELLGWMHSAAITTYRSDEDTVFDAQYYKFWEHYRFLKKFAKERGVEANAGNCPKDFKSLSFAKVAYFYLYPDTHDHPVLASAQGNIGIQDLIILDRALADYYPIITRSKAQKVLFLSGSSEGAHLTKVLRETGVDYQYLDIPVQDWEEWKRRPNYKGDRLMFNINNNSKNSLKILVADDDADSAKRIQSILNSGGYRNIKVTSKVRFFKELEGYDVVLLDIVWTKKDSIPEHEVSENFGFTGLRYLRSNSPQSIVILMSKSLFDLSDVESISLADAYFKSSIEGSKVLEQFATVMLDKRIKLLNLLEQMLLDGRADLFGLETQTYEKLLHETQQAKRNSQMGDQKSGWENFLQALTTLSPMLTGSNALLGIVNGLIKLISGG